MPDPEGVLVVAPVLVSLGTLLALLVFPERLAGRWRLSLIGAVALLVTAGALLRMVVVQGSVSVAFGGWALPFAIGFTADRLSASFVLLAAVAGLSASGAAARTDPSDSGPSHPHVLVHAFVAGACGAFLTADLFNLYVWLEVMLVASLGLLTAHGRPAQLDAAYRYFALNVVGTVFLLIGVVSIYAVTGHLNFAGIRQAIDGLPLGTTAPYAALLTVALLVKAAAFPVFAWLPATYHTLAPAHAAVFAAIGTKVGVYALLRLRTDVFVHDTAGFDPMLAVIAVATMLAGVLGAAHHWDVRRILAFHSVSQVGYLLLALALGTAGGIQAVLVFAVHHALVKSSLFLVAAGIRGETGSYDLRRCGGLFSVRPWLAVLFLLQAFSLVGLPPLSGFWAKLLVIRATLAEGHHGLAFVALGVGVLTLYSMLKIWVEAFWKPQPDEMRLGIRTGPERQLVVVAWVLAATTLALGVWPEPLVGLAADAASALVRGTGRP